MLTNAVVFRHAHRLPDGTIVVHAHPFLPKALGGPGSDPIQPNNHSRQELIWLDALTDVAYPFEDPQFFAFFTPQHLPLPAPDVAPTTQIRRPAFACFSHRGPPITA